MHKHAYENCWLINSKQLIRLYKTNYFTKFFYQINLHIHKYGTSCNKAEASWPQTTQQSRQLLTLFTQEGIVTAELLRPSEAKQKYRHLYEATKVIPKTF